jgi:NHL repeat
VAERRQARPLHFDEIRGRELRYTNDPIDALEGGRGELNMLRRIYFSFLALALLPFLASAQGVIQTVAGGGPNQLPGLSASLNFPSAVAVDKSGNVYVAVENDMRVYKIDTTGKLAVLAGNGVFGSTGDGGPATSAEFQFPSGIAVDGSGNVFISDGFASVVREVVASTGNIQTVAGNGVAGFSGDGGPAVNAGLNLPGGIAVDNSGNLFIADSGNSVVREVVAATGNLRNTRGWGLGHTNHKELSIRLFGGGGGEMLSGRGELEVDGLE